MAETSAYYRTQAENAQAEALASMLPNVRDRASQGARRWTALADQALAVERDRERTVWYRDSEVSAKGG